tara:strand:+ start:986 stop:1306 length:321 start_codon:yes stop_codon:yes gene_type:complete
MSFKLKSGNRSPFRQLGSKDITQRLLKKRSGLGPREEASAKVKVEQGVKREHPYWYKINGQNVSKSYYIKYEQKPGNMEGGGKQTNDPDVYGRKANNFGRGPKTKK